MRDIRNNVSPRFIKLCTGRQQGVPLRSTKYRLRNQRTETSVVEFSLAAVLTHESRIAKELLVSLNFDVVI